MEPCWTGLKVLNESPVAEYFVTIPDWLAKSNKGKEYVIQLEGDGLGKATSYPFEIGEHVLQKKAYQT